jgi:hypothetical protein
VADNHDDLHLEGAHGVLDGGPDAGVLGLQEACVRVSRIDGTSPCRRRACACFITLS